MSAPQPTADDLQQVLDRLAQVLNEHRTNYALIGGLGAAVRGTVRTTWDIDLLVATSQMELPRLLESLQQEEFDLEVYRAIRSWNEDNLLEFRYGQVRVDWIKALLPLFQRILERAKWEDIGGRPIRVADAEGLLVLKLIAMRPQDQQDIQGILTANRGLLDLDWVRCQWWAVVDEDDPAKLQFEQFVREFYVA
ncbi:MAG: nucleotidyltransferase [Planctomycetota bacterium]